MLQELAKIPSILEEKYIMQSQKITKELRRQPQNGRDNMSRNRDLQENIVSKQKFSWLPEENTRESKILQK